MRINWFLVPVLETFPHIFCSTYSPLDGGHPTNTSPFKSSLSFKPVTLILNYLQFLFICHFSILLTLQERICTWRWSLLVADNIIPEYISHTLFMKKIFVIPPYFMALDRCIYASKISTASQSQKKMFIYLFIPLTATVFLISLWMTILCVKFKFYLCLSTHWDRYKISGT